MARTSSFVPAKILDQNMDCPGDRGGETTRALMWRREAPLVYFYESLHVSAAPVDSLVL
jgi:hypothetical protein